MKAEIAIPRPISEAAEQLAQTLGMSLSELYTAAVAAYVTAHQRSEITETLNRVYATEPSAMDPAWVHIQLASVGETW
ncbi:MAG: ChpI protein [Anaerolineae bacterium]